MLAHFVRGASGLSRESALVDVAIALLSAALAGALVIGGTVLLLRRTVPKRVTSDGESPHPEFSGESSPAPQPIDPSTGQYRAHWVLPAAERAKGLVRPVRTCYRHKTCGVWTTMSRDLAETSARDPKFYVRTFCIACKRYLPSSQFEWEDGSPVGS
jgi:hypothetical protein